MENAPQPTVISAKPTSAYKIANGNGIHAGSSKNVGSSGKGRPVKPEKHVPTGRGLDVLPISAYRMAYQTLARQSDELLAMGLNQYALIYGDQAEIYSSHDEGLRRALNLSDKAFLLFRINTTQIRAHLDVKF